MAGLFVWVCGEVVKCSEGLLGARRAAPVGLLGVVACRMGLAVVYSESATRTLAA